MNRLYFLFLAILLILTFSTCKKNITIAPPIDSTQTIDTLSNSLQNTLGFGLLSKVKGIWNGSVSSTTPLGGYPEWIVDFRPISENQISSMNELDTINNIFMSFFIAKFKGKYKVFFRNGGAFAGQTRVSYLAADSVSETLNLSYYRFSEVIKGKNRAYTELTFKGDSLVMKSYTNKFNTLAEPTLHMAWKAKLQDTTACQQALDYFNFPKKTLTKDFTNTFDGQTEAIYYSITGGDPYNDSSQPYLGQATINYTFAANLNPETNKSVFLIITTQPLISGFNLNFTNLKYRSRYVILSSNDLSYTFTNMHPGTYYLYALYDKDNSLGFSSGDWVSTTNVTFLVGDKASITSGTQINFTIL